MLLLLCVMHTYGKKRIISCLCSCLYICVEITLDFGMTGRHIQVLVAECMCACVHANWLQGAVEMGVAYGKRVHNFQMGSETCTRFTAKVGHEPKDS